MLSDQLGGKNRTTAAISELLGCVFRGEFKVGDRLTETFLSEKLGISRTPVREALLELKGLGLVDVRRNRGAVFNGFTAVKLSEIYEVRRLLEVEATRHSTRRIDRQLLHDLLRDTRLLHDANADDDDWELDRRIHAAIALSCGNQTLAHEIQRFSMLVQAIRVTVGARVHVQQETTEQHLELLAAMTNGDPNAAGDAMRSHLEEAEKAAVAAIVDW
ncbi:MAG: DNA-binding GntR family transcriptional regulator [Verrucomicrobiales bacterium]|jgi:DNA-binding GntR family transcriptional regulator